jgi:hypothetical protein
LSTRFALLPGREFFNHIDRSVNVITGFETAVVVETSPGNFQVWLNHGRTLSDRFLSTLAARQLALRFGGDRGCADWRHFGRLAGFTNQKPNRRLRNGLPPFVRLRQCEGRTYTAAREFLEEVKSLAQKASAQRCTRTISRKTSTQQPIRSPAEFHRDARYGGDLHRADMAWALHAASRGLSERQIRDQLFRARDLSKKGLLKRQASYAERTACKALRIVEPNP